MGFWGIEVKPGKPHPYHSDNVQGRLYVTQATLGLGSTEERNILQCSVGHKSPIFLCSLLPGTNECCSLNLEFKDELVAFSVVGSRSIHLSGYFVSDEGENLRDEYDSESGEDIADTETDESSDYDYDDDEYFDDDFIEYDDEDDVDMISSSPNRKSSVMIEEIVDEDKPKSGNDDSKRPKKKKNDQSGDDQKKSKQQIVVASNARASVLESEDEDGFPISPSQNHRPMEKDAKLEDGGHDQDRNTPETMNQELSNGNDEIKGEKRKVTSADQDIQPEVKRNKKNKKKRKSKDLSEEKEDKMINHPSQDGFQPQDEKEQGSPDDNEHNPRNSKPEAATLPIHDSSAEKKKKKKKKKKKMTTTQETGEGTNDDQTASGNKDEGKSSLVSEEKQSTAKSSLGSEEKPSATKSSQVRAYPNGLVIEQLAMGIPDGKKASRGSQVSVHYIGKLKSNGKIFDSNVGKVPFKFRLGVGQVISGWDVGINGMRVGDKRRLTIPPSMGYGAKGAGGKIPPNAWLVFDVELVNVR